MGPRLHCYVGLALLLVGASAPGAEGQDKGIGVTGADVRPPCNWALLIGINGYVGQVPLRYCVKDAALLSRILRTQCGYQDHRVYLMVDGQKDFRTLPTRDNILETARLLVELPQEQDTLLFYFSGHGVSVNGKGYLVPIDARKAEAAQLVSIAELRDILRSSKSTRRVMILDACHSGGEKAADKTPMSPDFEEALRSDSEGMVTLASCRARETSLEAPWHEQGLFTHWLAQGLGGAADREQAGNRDGRVEVTELYQYVHERVRSEAVQHRSHPQNPFMLASISGRIDLARVSKPPDNEPSTTDPPPKPPPPKPSDVVERQGDYLMVIVNVTAEDELSRLQQARQRSRKLFAAYVQENVSPSADRSQLLEYARDHETLLDAEAEGNKLRYTVKIPLPRAR